MLFLFFLETRAQTIKSISNYGLLRGTIANGINDDGLFSELYLKRCEWKQHTVQILRKEQSFSLEIQPKNRRTAFNKLNMTYSMATMAIVGAIDVVVLAEVNAYYKRKNKPRPLFWNMETVLGWNEVLAIPGLLIVWGFRQLPGTDDRIWWYSSILAFAGVEDVFYQWLEPLYWRKFSPDYKELIRQAGYHNSRDVHWLNTWEQPLIWIQARLLYNNTVPTQAVYQSAFLGLVICYTF